MYAEPKVPDPERVRTLLSAAVDALGGSERPGQVEMADAVATAWTRIEHLLVQAGTGTGKSLTYLVPALLHADASDRPAIVATATLVLQAQLVDRDLPLLAAAVEPELGRPVGGTRTGATLRVEASDAASAFRKRPWLVMVDELTSWPDTTNHRRLWAAIASAMPKRPDSRLPVLSMAGSPVHFSRRIWATAQDRPDWYTSHVPGPCPGNRRARRGAAARN